jgi:CheY-like chemotaxis protein
MKKILAIDDEPGVTRMIKLNLEKTGAYEVLTANESRAALAAARQFQPDLILLDVMMPDLDGGEVAAQLESDPALNKVPVVFLTAIVTRTETGSRGLSSGGRRVVAKPITVKELIDCIEDALQESGSPPQENQ